VPEDIALFIDFENIRYSMLNIQRREPDPQELIAVARRYGTVMVARAYADWSRQPEPFKGSLTAAMIDRVDCPAKQRDRIRMGTIHYASGNTPTGMLNNSTNYSSEQGTGAFPASPRQWPSTVTGNSGALPALTPSVANNGWDAEQDTSHPLENDLEENLPLEDEQPTEESYSMSEYQQRDLYRPYQNSYGQSNPTGPLASSTGPLGYPPTGNQHTVSGNTGHMPAVNPSGNSTIVQSTVVQSTVD